MAINTVINVDVNTSKAVKNINDLNNEIIETTQVSKNLKTQLREMTVELQGLEPGIKRFNELSIAAGKLKDQINDTNAVIKATAGSGIENLGAGFSKVAGIGIGAFQGIASAQALFGNESENLQKTLVKLQALAGLSGAIKELGGLKDTLTDVKASFTAAISKSSLFNAVTREQAIATGTATTAQKVLNTVMKANPIFLVIGAVTALVGAFALFSSESEDVAKKEAERARATKAATEASKKENEEVSKSSAGFVNLIYQLKNTNSKSKEKKI
jgi:hypothetical protein